MRERLTSLGAFLLLVLLAAIVFPVLQLTAKQDSPLGCADYVCQFNQQCTKANVNCMSCAGSRCSDVQ